MAKRCATGGPDDVGRSTRLLERIADALGSPVEAFRSDSPDIVASAERDELLRLWSGLDRPTDRQRVLGFMRALVSGAPDA